MLKSFLITISLLGVIYTVNGTADFQTFNSTRDTGDDFYVVDMVQTQGMFFQGDKAHQPQILKTKDGVIDCRYLCVKHPECNSFNVGRSNSEEFFCEMTGYHYQDNDYEQVPQGADYDNYSFKIKRPAIDV